MNIHMKIAAMRQRLQLDESKKPKQDFVEPEPRRSTEEQYLSNQIEEEKKKYENLLERRKALGEILDERTEKLNRILDCAGKLKFAGDEYQLVYRLVALMKVLDIEVSGIDVNIYKCEAKGIAFLSVDPDEAIGRCGHGLIQLKPYKKEKAFPDFTLFGTTLEEHAKGRRGKRRRR